MTKATIEATCMAAAVAILGNKWTPHLISALADQPLGFCRLQEAVGGINPRTLSTRLAELETHSIINKIEDKGPNCGHYQLTAKGHDLLPILQNMAAWSAKYATPKTIA